MGPHKLYQIKIKIAEPAERQTRDVPKTLCPFNGSLAE